MFTRLKRTSIFANTVSAGRTMPSVHARFAWAARVSPWLVAGVFVVLAVRLANFISSYTVNIIYWDQWDFLQGLFDGADAWTLFRWQHGPQRQGLGNLIIAGDCPAECRDATP